MHCQEVKQMLSAYLDGMLDPSVRDRADRHLEGCPACRLELDELQMVVGLVQDLPEVGPPAGFRQELRRRLELEAVPPVRSGLFRRMAGGRWSVLVAAAASFVLVIGMAAAWQGLPWQGGPPARVATESNYAVKDLAAEDQQKASQAPENAPQGAGADLTPLDEGKPPGETSARQSLSAKAPEDPAQAIALMRAADQEGGVAASPVRSDYMMKTYDTAAAKVGDADPVQGRKFSAGNGSAGIARGTAAVPSTAEPGQPRQAVMDVKVGDRDLAVREVLEIARKLGGIASLQPGSDGRELVLTVPGDRFEVAMADIGRTGKVIRQDVQQPAPAAGVPTGAPGVQSLGFGGGGTVAPAPADSVILPQKPVLPPQSDTLKEEAPPGNSGDPAMSTIIVRLQ